jgi:hypothetical protein
MISSKLIIDDGYIVKSLTLKSENPFKFFDILDYINKLYTLTNKCQLSFYLCQNDRILLVNDIEKFIKNNDEILVKIIRPSSYYALIDSKNNFLFSAYHLRDLYNYFYDYIQSPLYNNSPQAMLIYEINEYNMGKLIDVLDTPKRHLNECVNRLIHNYNY